MTDRDILLGEVLAEAEPGGFREALLVETLRLAGRRRWGRRARRVGMAVALCLFGAFAWRFVAPTELRVSAPAAYKMVHTEALAASAVLATHRFDADIVRTSVANVAVIRTRPAAGLFRSLDDNELLALVAPRRAALVRVGPNSEKLVFVRPEDQKALFSN